MGAKKRLVREPGYTALLQYHLSARFRRQRIDPCCVLYPVMVEVIALISKW